MGSCLQKTPPRFGRQDLSLSFAACSQKILFPAANGGFFAPERNFHDPPREFALFG
jgi:hypothetical protein